MSTSAGVPDGVCDGDGASGQSCFTLQQSHLPAAPHKLRKLSTPVPECLLSKVNYLNHSVSLPPAYASQKQSQRRHIIVLHKFGGEIDGTRRGVCSLSHRHTYSSLLLTWLSWERKIETPFITLLNFDCLQPKWSQNHKIHAHFKTEASCLISVPATCVLPLNTQQATQKSWEKRAVPEALCCAPGAFTIQKKPPKKLILLLLRKQRRACRGRAP